MRIATALVALVTLACAPEAPTSPATPPATVNAQAAVASITVTPAGPISVAVGQIATVTISFLRRNGREADEVPLQTWYSCVNNVCPSGGRALEVWRSGAGQYGIKGVLAGSFIVVWATEDRQYATLLVTVTP